MSAHEPVSPDPAPPSANPFAGELGGPAYPPPSPATPPPPFAGPQPPQYAAPAQPYGGVPTVQPISAESEKQVGALAHGVAAAATFLSGGTLGFVAALVIYLIYRDKGPFVRAHAANALNVQITTGIGLLISAVLMFVLIGFITYPIIWVLGIVFHVIGAVKAMNGEWWKPPMTIDFVK